MGSLGSVGKVLNRSQSIGTKCYPTTVRVRISFDLKFSSRYILKQYLATNLLEEIFKWGCNCLHKHLKLSCSATLNGILETITNLEISFLQASLGKRASTASVSTIALHHNQIKFNIHTNHTCSTHLLISNIKWINKNIQTSIDVNTYIEMTFN